LGFLVNVGLDYLTLQRSAGSLSGGEAQRIRLATQIGSRLMGVLYVLDEPSIGLHPRDNDRLLVTLEEMRDLGNTVLIVEHDEETIRRADWIVDMGPGAGDLGGEVVAEGPPEEIIDHPVSLTGAYLSGRRFVLDQAGMIHVFRPGSVAGKLFLDLRPGTSPWAKYNEEGLLGLAFHPKFKDTGEFFVTYSLAGDQRVEHLARFRVRADDPDRADPASEELVLAVEQPFWNHNGGSIAFGPDGFLYWALGDGGSRDDPFGNGQKIDTLLGKILRLATPGARSSPSASATPGRSPSTRRRATSGPPTWGRTSGRR